MSGICAVWLNDASERGGGLLSAMTAGLSIGAERPLQESDCNAGVGVSARFATQQIYRDDRVLVACDAELYNQDELVEIAGGKMDVPAGAKTAALMAALYGRLGPGFVDKLRGPFSVVLWDFIERKLFAAIDGFGIKRLACYQDARMTLIASRVTALARTGKISLEINPRAVANVLNFSSDLAPETIYTKIQRLEPGTLLVVDGRGTRREKYWDMRYGVGSDSSEDSLARQLEIEMQRSVSDHCGKDSFSEVGAFLSGGTDSSTVLGMMSHLSKEPVKAFSIGFQDHRFNELEYAEIAARAFHASHFTYLVGPEDCFNALPDVVRSFDEPFGNSSAIPTYFCARLAAQNGVNTLLAGDGGDELFGGNERYATDMIFESYYRIPSAFRGGLIEPVLAALPPSIGLIRRGRGYVNRAKMPGVERMLSFQFLKSHSAADIFEGDFLRELGGYTIENIPSRYYAKASASDHLDRLLYVDMNITLADNDLPKVNCTTELAGIQARFPFLDRSLAEFSGRIPARLKVKGFQKRYLFKKAFGQLLPREILQKKKHGFGIPVAHWLKSDRRMRELAHDTLLSARAFERGYFRRQFIEDLFRKHESDDSTYYGDTLWTFLTLELWHRCAINDSVGTTA